MDLEAIIAAVGSAVLGIGAVAAFFARIIPPVAKYVSLAKDAINALDHIIEAFEDGTLTQDEIEKVKGDIELFKSTLKK